MSSNKIIKLDGTAINPDGSSYKSNFFKFLELHPDDYSDISFTVEEAKKVQRHLQHLSTGASAAIPLLCGGAAQCPFATQCVFVKIDKERRAQDPKADLITPIGRQCLTEINLLNEYTKYYVMEYEIDEHSFTEIQMVRELAEIELMLWRLNNNLAKPEHASLVSDNVVSVTPQGEAITRLEMNAFIETKDRLK